MAISVTHLDSLEPRLLLAHAWGGFLPKQDYAVGSQPAGIVTGDFNGDGKIDLAVAN